MRAKMPCRLPEGFTLMKAEKAETRSVNSYALLATGHGSADAPA